MGADLALDLTPVRAHRELRLLFVSQLGGMLGYGVTQVAIPFQAYALTHSSLWVGWTALAQAVATIAGLLRGGTLADSKDRRRVLIGTRLLMAATSAALALNAVAARPQLWLLVALAAASAAGFGLGSPTRIATVPRLVSPELLPAASALQAIINQVGLLVGPATAGLVIGFSGITSAFGLAAAGMFLSALPLISMHPLPRSATAALGGSRTFPDALRFVGKSRVILGILLVDTNAMVFGMPRAVFPALAIETFHGGATAVGLLFAAPSAGAMLAAATSGWISRVQHAGRVILFAVAVWGAAIAAIGLTSQLPIALALLAVAGAADVVSEVLRLTILQLRTPDALRGRVTSVLLAQTAASPLLGDTEAGMVAAAATPALSVLTGGLASLAGVLLIAVAFPALRTARLKPTPAQDVPVEHAQDHGALTAPTAREADRQRGP